MATIAMYSVIYGVVLNPFPYKNMDRLTSEVWPPEQRGYLRLSASRKNRSGKIRKGRHSTMEAEC